MGSSRNMLCCRSFAIMVRYPNRVHLVILAPLLKIPSFVLQWLNLSHLNHEQKTKGLFLYVGNEILPLVAGTIIGIGWNPFDGTGYHFVDKIMIFCAHLQPKPIRPAQTSYYATKRAMAVSKDAYHRKMCCEPLSAVVSSDLTLDPSSSGNSCLPDWACSVL